MYGIDVEKNRIDSLDKKIIEFALSITNEKKKVVDLGSGSSRISIILSLMGWEAVLYDIQDYSEKFSKINKELDTKIKFFQKYITKLSDSDFLHISESKIVIIHRMLHYLKYNDAVDLLKKIKSTKKDNTKVFISITTTSSPIAKTYKCKEEKIENRFCRIEKQEEKKYNINTKLCLYNENDIDYLIKNSGLCLEYKEISRFGNAKIILT